MDVYPAPAAATEVIQHGMKVRATVIADAIALDLEPNELGSANFIDASMLVAARYHGPEFDGNQVGVWALSPSASGGYSCYAIDVDANAWSDWGEDIKADSRPGQELRRISELPQVQDLRAVVARSG